MLMQNQHFIWSVKWKKYLQPFFDAYINVSCLYYKRKLPSLNTAQWFIEIHEDIYFVVIFHSYLFFVTIHVLTYDNVSLCSYYDLNIGISDTKVWTPPKECRQWLSIVACRVNYLINNLAWNWIALFCVVFSPFHGGVF